MPLCTLVIMTVLLVMLVIPTPKDKLGKAVAGADRVVIVAEHLAPMQIEMNGRDKVAELLECIDIEQEAAQYGNSESCRIEIYKGEEMLARISFVELERLRWADGKWEGDAMLTEQSRATLIGWLAQHGWKMP